MTYDELAQRKPELADQVKRGPGRDAGPANVARVPGDLGFDEHHAKRHASVYHKSG